VTHVRDPKRRACVAIAAAAAVIGVPLAAHTMTGAEAGPSGSRPASGPAVVSGPIAVLPADVFTTPVTNGASANALYAFLADRQNHLVHLQVPVSKPVAASLGKKTKSITLSTGCTPTSTSSICVDTVNAAGVTLTATGTGLEVESSGGTYTVAGDARVGPATRDAKGTYTIPLQGQDVGAAGTGEDRD
jgi:hypothetical protein